ncbi:MAG TPA: hypothetical protein VLB44_08920 [Kofleriaceae bacterium]|nr:hypothetical protein [Kofleriaceae bacterium]
MTRSFFLLVLTAVAACSSPAAMPPEADAAIDGATIDTSQVAPEIEILYRSRDGMAMPCAPDAPVPLTLPPQGGFVLLVGLRAKHLDPTSIDVTASIRDTVDDQLLSVEQRPVMLVPGSDGWATPDMPDGLFNWANLPACPLAGATRDVFQQPYLLRVAVEDASGAKAEAKLTIVPTCEAGAAGDLCRCQCKQGYKLGDACP